MPPSCCSGVENGKKRAVELGDAFHESVEAAEK